MPYKETNRRLHGLPPYRVAVVHGGPGATGSVADLASELGRYFGTIEPFQTRESIDELVSELRDLLPDSPVVLIGHSWGAWLSIIFASAYPDIVKKLILVSSGPFNEGYVPCIERKRLDKLDKYGKKAYFDLMVKIAETPDDNSYLLKFARLISEADNYSILPESSENPLKIDIRLYRSIWSEALLLRRSGSLLNLAGKVDAKIVVIHGKDDPHPYKGVEKPLREANIDIGFHLLFRCGHYPWREIHAREEFLNILISEIENAF